MALLIKYKTPPRKVSKLRSANRQHPHDATDSAAAKLSAVSFPTELGWIVLHWNERGVTRLQFGFPSPAAARGAVRGAVELCELADPQEAADETWPNWLADAIVRLATYAEGKPVDLKPIPLDNHAEGDFSQKVVRACRAIPRGKVRTYGQIAAAAGSPRAARAVGRVMATNQVPLLIPCHRVVGSKGLHGYSAPGGLDTKRRLLAIESPADGGEK